MLAGTIGGNAATGDGNVLTGTAGASKGIIVQLGESATDSAASVGGAGAIQAQGQVTVAKNSSVFQIGANKGQTVSIAVDSVASAGLGSALPETISPTLTHRRDIG